MSNNEYHNTYIPYKFYFCCSCINLKMREISLLMRKLHALPFDLIIFYLHLFFTSMDYLKTLIITALGELISINEYHNTYIPRKFCFCVSCF